MASHSRARRSVSRRPAGAPPAPRAHSFGTQEKIVAAALEVFAERGFEGARTREICDRAGVNQGLITYHFSSKEALWKAAVDSIFARLRESLGGRLNALEEIEPRTRLRLTIRHYIRFAAEHPELHRLMVNEGAWAGPRLEWLVERHVRPLFETSCALLRAAQADGALPAIEPLHLHYILIGAAAHFFVMAPEVRLLTGKDPSGAETVEKHVDAVLALFLGASREPKATRPATRKSNATPGRRAAEGRTR